MIKGQSTLVEALKPASISDFSEFVGDDSKIFNRESARVEISDDKTPTNTLADLLQRNDFLERHSEWSIRNRKIHSIDSYPVQIDMNRATELRKVCFFAV